MNKRSVEISDGSILELEYNEEFFSKIRKYFSLDECEEVSDDHLKVFFCDAFKSAVQNNEEII